MAAKNDKVRWSNYSTETISTIYATLIANELENMSPDDYNSFADSAVLIKDFVKTLCSTREAYSQKQEVW